MTDAGGQAAWDDDAALRSRRRGLVAAVALCLALALLISALAISRSGSDGDVLALGPASDPSDLPPVDDTALFTDGTGPGGQSQLAPGDSTPAAGAAGGDPAVAAAAGDPAGGGTPGAAGSGAPGGGGGAAAGPPGPGPGQGIPTPTTRPGSSGTPTTASPGTTQPPNNPPPCAITNLSVSPNPITSYRSNQKLEADVRVTFRPTNCGSAEYRVAVNGLNLPAVPTIDGFYDAFIRENAEKWNKGDHTITVSGGGASAPATLTVM